MYELKLCKMGEKTAMVLPPDIIEKMQCKAGDSMKLSVEGDTLHVQPFKITAPMDPTIIEALMREEDA